MDNNDLDNLSFYELCNKAGFVKNKRIDTAALAVFYDKSERTIYRMLATGTFHPMNIKLLKMQILNIRLNDQLDILLQGDKKYPFIYQLIESLNKRKMEDIISYPSIKKRAMKIALSIIIFLYKRINS